MSPARLPLPLLFALATVAVRVPVLLAHGDTWYPFEVHAGTIAQALLDGLDLDVATLPIIPHIRGGALSGLLLAPLYALFGPSALVMKIVPLLWHALTVALAVGLMQRFVCRRAAGIAGLLFVCAPPMLQKLSVLGLQSHMESSLLFLAALWPFLAMTRDGLFSTSRWAAFGGAVGLAGFFHLQALLPCLALVGLLIVWEPRRVFLSTGSLVALLVGAVCGAPSFLFTGGNVALLRGGMFRGSVAPPPDIDAPTELGERLTHLITDDLTTMLEFGELDSGIAGPLAWVYLVALVLGAGVAVWQGRAGMLEGLRRLIGRRSETPLFVGAAFLAHVLLITALYGRSDLRLSEAVGTGMLNRYFGPWFFSCTMLCALGLAGVPAMFRRLVVLSACAAAAAAWVPTVRFESALRPAQRGAVYEWFGAQLNRLNGGDPEQSVVLLKRIDDGDARFRSLRFAVPVRNLAPVEERLMTTGRMPWSRDAASAFRATQLGRRVVARWEELLEPGLAKKLLGLPPTARVALFHGIGLSVRVPRPIQGRARTLDFLFLFQEQLKALGRDAVFVAEGYGFGLGSVFDPYNLGMHEQLRLNARLVVPGPVKDALYRGVGWGIRQRYLEPPTSDDLLSGRLGGLADLDTLRFIPEAHQDAFLDGYLARRLPAEAALFED